MKKKWRKDLSLNTARINYSICASVALLFLVLFLLSPVVIAQEEIDVDKENASPRNERQHADEDIRKAIRYREFRDALQIGDPDREFFVSSGYASIDINSLIEIEINETIIRNIAKRIAPVETELLDSVQNLNTALQGVNAAYSAMRVASELVAQRHKATEETTKAFKLLSSVLKPLSKSLDLRVRVELGFPDEERLVSDRKNEMTSPILRMPPKHYGINWEALRMLLNEQIEWTEEQITRLSPGLRFRIRAYLQKDPLHLPGYNSVPDCKEQPYEKIVWALSEEQKKLMQSIKEIAENSLNFRNVATAYLTSLVRDYTPELKTEIDNIGRQLDSIAGDIERVKNEYVQIFSESNIKLWINEIKQAASTSIDNDELNNHVKKLRDSIEPYFAVVTLVRTLAGDNSDVTSLNGLIRAVSSLPVVIANAQALVDVINNNNWQDIAVVFDEIQEQIEEVITDENVRRIVLAGSDTARSPFTVVSDVKVISDKIRTSFVGLNRARTWILRLLVGGPPSVSLTDLRVPQGQQERDLSDNLDTFFNLQRSCTRPQPGNRVTVVYELLEPTGVENAYNEGDKNRVRAQVSDVLTIDAYGHRFNPFAHLAWVARFDDSGPASDADSDAQKSGVFRPHAAVSWTYKYNPWPHDGEANPASWPLRDFGIGFTTMELDFSDEKDTEIGLAGTITYYNDLLVFGVGANLSISDNRWFAFFTIRLESYLGKVFSNK